MLELLIICGIIALTIFVLIVLILLAAVITDEFRNGWTILVFPLLVASVIFTMGTAFMQIDKVAYADEYSDSDDEFRSPTRYHYDQLGQLEQKRDCYREANRRLEKLTYNEVMKGMDHYYAGLCD